MRIPMPFYLQRLIAPDGVLPVISRSNTPRATRAWEEP